MSADADESDAQRAELHTALTGIHGIGDAKADEILGLVEEHSGSGGSASPEGVAENVRAAYGHLDAGQPGHAEKFLRRAVAALDDAAED